jgi:hypothetical protein
MTMLSTHVSPNQRDATPTAERLAKQSRQQDSLTLDRFDGSELASRKRRCNKTAATLSTSPHHPHLVAGWLTGMW